ncbi:MAG: NCS2 family permease [Deferribacterota bacterium]|nr:NCS2 family permease [Deferribacterota bacterium]
MFFKNLIYNIFKLKEKNTTIAREILAGITTFVTMAYVIFINPAILSKTGMDPSAVLIATVIGSAFGCLLMGILANYPFALAPGMGLTAYFAYIVVGQMGYSWQAALGAVFMAALIFLLLTILKIRNLIIKGIPESLKSSISVGIGLFISFIGLKESGIIVSNSSTFLSLGDMTNTSPLLAIVGLVVIAILRSRDVKGAILIGVVFVWVISIILGVSQFNGFISKPPSIEPVFLKLDILNILDISYLSVIFVILFVALFDATGTFLGVSKLGGFLVNGELPRMTRALSIDAVSTMFGAALGTSPVTVYVESSSGILAGGKTGLTSVVVGILFLLSIFIAPIATSIPIFAVSPALIIIGSYMMSSVRDINWSDFTEALPSFLLIVFMPFTFSIANGIVIGVIVYPILKLFTGKIQETTPLMWILMLLFLLKFFYEGIIKWIL